MVTFKLRTVNEYDLGTMDQVVFGIEPKRDNHPHRHPAHRYEEKQAKFVHMAQGKTRPNHRRDHSSTYI